MGRWTRRLTTLFAKFASVAERGTVRDVGSGTGALAVALTEGHPAWAEFSTAIAIAEDM